MSEPTLIVVAIIIILALLLIGTLAMFWPKRR
jgi:hypothetical protein